METTLDAQVVSKESVYKKTLVELESLLVEDDDLVASMANTSALLKLNLTSFSWVGFYLVDGKEIVLGPFQGKPACVRIEFGKGVCGTVAATVESKIVEDVRTFPGHIACDPLSRSEIVIPVKKDGELLAVLDVDSEKLANFDELDRRYLEKVVELLIPKFRKPSKRD